MKKKVILALILVVIFIFVNNKEKELNVLETKELNNNTLSMMLETSAGTGEYQEATASSWPTEGYVFNENLSKCENGGILSWDNTKKIVVMSGNISDKCYVYFDKEPDTLANYIKSQYTGTQGANNLYLHDSTLENGAGDNSYRFAGPSETTNNFVCFGYDSKDGSCPIDNLYRIIGVFDDQVKLIKYDYAKSTLLGTDGDYSSTYSAAGMSSSSYGNNKGQNSKEEIGVYYWSTNSNSTWSESRLNTINLNKNYINNIGTKWSEKISDHTWKVGGNTWNNIGTQTAPSAYQNEINGPATNKTVNAKVGLMYVSDYGYAASSSSWSTALNSYNNVIANNCMYMGLYEWTLASRTDISDIAFVVDYTGYVYYYYVYRSYGAVRPVFYLKPEIAYSVGSGTISSPYILE